MSVQASRTPLGTPLTGGRTLIEASAGSGKTRAITTLVARLVVEQEHELDSILVVTFTKAATAELRKRIRRTLKAIADADCKASAAEDDQARELLGKWEAMEGLDAARVRERIKLALLDIDRANILTIHGFCQRALTEFAFETGSPFDFEVSGDGAGIVESVVHDFWQDRYRNSSRILARVLAKKKFLPDELANWYAGLRAKRFQEIRGVPESAKDPIKAENECREKLASIVPLWYEQRVEFCEIVLESDAFHRGQYRLDTIKPRLDTFEKIAATGELPIDMIGLEELARYFGATYAAQKCKKGCELPENPLFAAFDELAEACAAFQDQLTVGLRLVRRELIEHADAEVRRLVRDERRLGYDDLLIELRDALDGENTESRLAVSIRRRFPAALIDEFQDTDPTQEQIFTSIYGNRASAGPETHSGPQTRGEPEPPNRGALYIVGDPKQSIYEFRGADIFAYLGAQQESDASLELDSNFRSAPALVEACNAIFDAPMAFTIPEIGFSPMKPGRDDGIRLEIDGLAPPPFALWLLDDQNKVGDAEEAAVKKTANDIINLLELARDGKARIGETPLRASDITILVPTRATGRKIAKALRRRGGRCVEIDDASVFESREAEQIHRLLLALANPGRQDYRRAALAGDLFGLDSERLFALVEDDEYWSEWAGRCADWRDYWQSSGVGAMLRRIIGAEGGAGSLLRCEDGLRRLTNFYHLAELLQEAETENRFSPAGLLAWLKRAIAGRAGKKEGEEDAFTLRLDSDEDLVRIMTIHRSKGLEFPIVYLPFAWYSKEVDARSDEPLSYHVRNGGRFPAVLDLAPDDASRHRRELEEFGESVRLLYVALTRARERCIVAWTRITNKSNKRLPPLAWLLHRQGEPVEAPAESKDGSRSADSAAPDSRAKNAAVPAGVAAAHIGLKNDFREKDRVEFDSDVAAVADRCPQGMEVVDLEKDAAMEARAMGEEDDTALERREFSRPIRRIRQMTSFTALAADQAAPATAHRLEESDAIDHDQSVGVLRTGADAKEVEAKSPVLDTFHFPRGIRVGTCLHRIFEIHDEQPEYGIDEICKDQLQRADIDQKWRPVASAMVKNTLATELREPGQGGFRLADIDRRLTELEFFFPVKDLSRQGLAETLAQCGYAELLRVGFDRQAIDGFLRGFVDLAFERDGRWYIADYKSNWLGDQADDYRRERLADSMAEHSYPLQYLIYLLALHRYLRTRLPGYDYERHIGGVFYLFLRGMDPATGMSRGVWFDRPGKACIEALDGFMKGAES